MRSDINPSVLLRRHEEAEYIGSWVDLVADIEERYALSPQSLLKRVGDRRERLERLGGPFSQLQQQEHDAECVLFALPDAEFLTVLENAVGHNPPPYVSRSSAADLLLAADGQTIHSR